jgi:hypothetical protein
MWFYVCMKNSVKHVLGVGYESKNVFGDRPIKVAHCKIIIK